MFSSIDHSIFFFLNHTLANPVCDAIIGLFLKIPGQFCLVLTGAVVLTGVVVLIAGKRRHKISVLILLFAFTIAGYSYKVIKGFIHRPRPFRTLDRVRLIMGPNNGFSFPSGHSTTSFCLATVLAIRYPKLRYPAFMVAALVAFSRVYIGVHYPSDIFAGSLLGMFIGYMVTKVSNNALKNEA